MAHSKKHHDNSTDDSEQRVEKALEILEERNPLFAKHLSGPTLDSNQIDFLILLSSFLAFPLQVKGEWAMRDHYKKQPCVYALLVRKSHTPEMIADRIESLVMNILKHDPAKVKAKPAPADKAENKKHALPLRPRRYDLAIAAVSAAIAS